MRKDRTRLSVPGQREGRKLPPAPLGGPAGSEDTGLGEPTAGTQSTQSGASPGAGSQLPLPSPCFGHVISSPCVGMMLAPRPRDCRRTERLHVEGCP